MPEDVAAVVDVPEVSDAVETVETPVESAPETAEQPTTEAEPQEAAASKQDGRSFSGKARELYKQLSASTDPADQKFAKEFKDLFFSQKALNEKYPGGLKEIEERIANFERFGDPEKLETLQADAQTLEQIDSKWMAGDPGFIEELASLNPESFKKLAPVALNKFAQIDPEGYQRVMSGILSTTLAQAKMGDQLYLINYALSKGDVEEAKNLIGQISKWMGDLDAAGKAAVPEQPKENPEFLKQREEFEEKQAAFFNQQLATEVNGWRDSAIKAAVSKMNGGKQMDAERFEVLQDRVIRELHKLHPSDFEDKFQRLYAQGDKDAIVKFIKGADEGNVSKVVAKVYTLLFGAPKTIARPAQTPQPKQPVNGANAGWIQLPKRPDPQSIDRSRGATTDDMILSGRAILRDGRKVMWNRV